jgi:hypothetical protein
VADESAAMLFIDAGTEPHAYDAMLHRGGPAKGWLFGMDRYGSASDRGGWSIYCEKGNDVAAIALRQPDDMEKYVEYLKQLHAERITVGRLCDARSIRPIDRALASRPCPALRRAAMLAGATITIVPSWI